MSYKTNIPAKHDKIFILIKESIINAREKSKKNVKCYVVGGYVRDLLLGKRPKDIDCVCNHVDLVMKELKLLLINRKTNFKSVEYATFGTLLMRFYDEDVEFVIPRKESYRTSGSRNPTVSRGTFIDDVMRRDFTVNTLYLSLNPENYLQIEDLTGKGRYDLKLMRLDTPKNPDITFNEDPLRMLRLARFISVKEFKPSRKVLMASRKNAKRIKIIVPERIIEEIKRSYHKKNYFRVLNELGLLKYIFPEVHVLKKVPQKEEWHKYNAFEHTMRIIECLPTKMKLAGLYHDTGKIQFLTTGNFAGHEQLSETLAMKRFTELKLTNKEIKYYRYIIRNHMLTLYLSSDKKIKDASIKRYLKKHNGYIDDFIKFSKCDKKASGKQVQKKLLEIKKFEERIKKIQEKSPVPKKLALTGDDIMRLLNIKPGTEVGKIKKELMDLVIEGKLQNTSSNIADYIVNKYQKKNRLS